jgi:hypothetical protein
VIFIAAHFFVASSVASCAVLQYRLLSYSLSPQTARPKNRSSFVNLPLLLLRWHQHKND